MLSGREGFSGLLAGRLGAPLHLNIASVLAALGPFKTKVAFDLVQRPQYAYGVLRAAELAALHGVSRISCLEFGVASGAGLMNMAYLAERAAKATGVDIEVHGFDTGRGMPPPVDTRDHPELYATGDYPMDQERLKKSLPENAELHLGPLGETLPRYLSEFDSTVGFVSLDVDYYSSATDALKVFDGPAVHYLPATLLYVDDVDAETHNPWCGELLAIREFNESREHRKIGTYRGLRSQRIFKNAFWMDRFFLVHVLDHPVRIHGRREPQRIIANSYLK